MKGYSFPQKSFAIPMILILMIFTTLTPSVASGTVEASSAAEWTVTITVNATPEGVTERKIGIRDGATDLFDEGIDVKGPPPGFAFYAWLEADDIEAYRYLWEDYRGPATPAAPNITWELRVQSEDFPITISWDDSEIPAGSEVEIKLIGMMQISFPYTTLGPGPYWFTIRVTPPAVDIEPPVITLNGDNPMTVECGDDYIEPGATATDETCITEEVSIGGDTVDTSTVDTYYVTYDVSDCAGNPAVQVTRTVNVVDTTAPTITLLGDNPMTVECGDSYVEPGATASDSCCITEEVSTGGDIVDTGTVGTYYVTYDVSDCTGNPAVQVTRTVNVVDTTAPTITLNGDNPMTVECGDSYVEPGATASDSCCITEEVTIGGDIVDTGTVGTYYVTYDVSDCAGNPAVQVVRTVNVVEEAETPHDMIDELSDDIDAMELFHGLTNRLTASLNAAMQVLSDSDPTNDMDAKNILRAFTNKVEAQRGKMIGDELADELVTRAQEIMAELNGAEMSLNMHQSTLLNKWIVRLCSPR